MDPGTAYAIFFLALAAFFVGRWAANRLIDVVAARYVRRERQLWRDAWHRDWGEGPPDD